MSKQTSEVPLSIRDLVKFRGDRKFDIKTLPADMQRVYKSLAKKFDDDYALHVMFTMRTAIELHRAWHMTLLTNKIMQQLKDCFRLRMVSWEGISLFFETASDVLL